MLEQAQQDPDGGIVSMASRLDLHYLQRAGRFSPADVQRWWAVTEDPSWNISSAAITGPVVAYFDAAALAGLRDPWDRLITATAIDLGTPIFTKHRAITAIAQAGPVEIVQQPARFIYAHGLASHRLRRHKITRRHISCISDWSTRCYAFQPMVPSEGAASTDTDALRVIGLCPYALSPSCSRGGLEEGFPAAPAR